MEASRERGLTRTPLPAPTLAALERHLFEVRPEDLSLVGSLPFFSSSQNELFGEQFEFLVFCFVFLFPRVVSNAETTPRFLSRLSMI